MENNFQKMIDRALEVKAKYDKIEPKEWGVDQDFMGMVKDVGDLGKILMVARGYRDDIDRNKTGALPHELSDILFSLITIANKTGVDLEKAFHKTMDELDERLK